MEQITAMEYINNFTYNDLISLKYSKQVVLDLANNALEYSEYMMRLILINREKRFRALNKRTSIQYQNGMLTYRDAMSEQLRHYIKCGTEEEDFDKMKMDIFYHYYDKIQEDIRAQRVLDQALKPILIKKFNKDLKVISVRTYDYPAHWRARGYKTDRITLGISKTRIVNWYRKKCHSKI
jgi:hypothetical protein